MALFLIALALNLSLQSRVLAHLDVPVADAPVEYGYFSPDDHDHVHDEIHEQIDHAHGHSHHVVDHDHGGIMVFPLYSNQTTPHFGTAPSAEQDRYRWRRIRYGHYRPPRA